MSCQICRQTEQFSESSKTSHFSPSLQSCKTDFSCVFSSLPDVWEVTPARSYSFLKLFVSWGFPNWTVNSCSMAWVSVGEGSSACQLFDGDGEDLLIQPHAIPWVWPRTFNAPTYIGEVEMALKVYKGYILV